ncbi:MAG TPA: flagellar basal body-associated protein FliL [Pseudomonas sp.]|uniref:flagellar basal body-associated protein FliL n=1 Tax=Stutzerimonas xanthomarina TaxID=271420 RepID=UPI000E9F6C08|nr:flagellar basal body-associated protein FliL [Stutzerimonas xanthomarina]MBU0853964.1 flagellar basal body-associated protein FliL [Gammaproteobacteria bacterium]HAQ88395.1 flagellar basal body-associated protein FliL [Pseudomonas sp.]MBK3849383.1 flagellar basal body-associated protein FliL [Stutzerimonas xanthomarina]MBU2371722.1 flagellar basal body-associated protein FliL [Gammaproteobacteria bacterium]HAW23464.1 flagellar basal body-associated protein FliL [Pseudomonas sp.]
MKRIILLCLALGLALPVFANSPEPEEGAALKTIYYGLVPALVGNYGSDGKLKYYKADIALRVTGSEAEAKVKHHEPLIRNQLVILFSQQTDASLGSVEAKEALRQEALKQVQAVLTQEEGKPLVDDLLFNNLIIQ